MPRFFFHSADGVFNPDSEGTELPDLGTAQLEAVRFAGEIMRDDPQAIWEDKTFRVEVSDDAGKLLCAVIILGLEAAVTSQVKGRASGETRPLTA